MTYRENTYLLIEHRRNRERFVGIAGREVHTTQRFQYQEILVYRPTGENYGPINYATLNEEARRANPDAPGPSNTFAILRELTPAEHLRFVQNRVRLNTEAEERQRQTEERDRAMAAFNRLVNETPQVVAVGEIPNPVPNNDFEEIPEVTDGPVPVEAGTPQPLRINNEGEAFTYRHLNIQDFSQFFEQARQDPSVVGEREVPTTRRPALRTFDTTIYGTMPIFQPRSSIVSLGGQVGVGFTEIDPTLPHTVNRHDYTTTVPKNRYLRFIVGRVTITLCEKRIGSQVVMREYMDERGNVWRNALAHTAIPLSGVQRDQFGTMWWSVESKQKKNNFNKKHKGKPMPLIKEPKNYDSKKFIA
jgi:hypothetical protein